MIRRAVGCIVVVLLLVASVSSADSTMIQPKDLFPEFPQISFGMTYEAVKSEVEKNGGRAGGNKTEMAWDGKFGDFNGRATVHFKENRAVQISVVSFAMEKRNELFEKWSKLLTEKHGAAEDSDTSDVKSKLWRLKTGIAIELRLVKDENSPVVDVRWVKL